MRDFTLRESIALVEHEQAAWRYVVANVTATKDYAEWRRAHRSAEDAARRRLTKHGVLIRDGGCSVTAIKFASIRSTSTGGLLGAIGNWLRAARTRLEKQEAGDAKD